MRYSIFRGILAVLGAYVAIVVVVLVGQVVSTQSLVAGGLGAMRAAADGGAASMPSPGATYLVVNLVVALLAAMLGGWLVMRFAPPPRLRWAGILAALLLLAGEGLASRTSQPGQSGWYPYVVPLLGAAGAMAGAFLYPH